MIDPSRFLKVCEEQGITFFTGVPDSLLKHLNAEIMASLPKDRHVIAANEGTAVGIAMGHYLRTSQPTAVYLQNSGFGNTVNPLLSLADPEVYGIPMLLIVGWRGQPGVNDEPQHVKQGRAMASLLQTLEVPWSVLPQESTAAEHALKGAVATALANSSPYVLMVEKGTFAEASTEATAATQNSPLPSREEALIAVAGAVGDGPAIVSTTGMLSRELFEYRTVTGRDGSRDFLTVGGMGHASSIGLGIAMSDPDREVWCFDGDGAALMHLGSMSVIAGHASPRYFHVVFNNGVHDSVGGQPTSLGTGRITTVAQALGYRHAASTADLDAVPDAIAELRERGGPSLLELQVRPGSRANLGRPTRTPAEAKGDFMKALGTYD